jgi:hypothetical protein
MGGYFRPSICAATTFQNFLIVPLKAIIFEKYTFTTQIDFLSFAPRYTADDGGKPQISGKSLWQAAHHKKKTCCTLLPASHVGEQTGGEKLVALLSLWQPLLKFLSQGGRPQTTKIGR